MSNQKHRTYSEDFKREALALLSSSEKSARQIEVDLGITPGLLLKWRDHYQVTTGPTGAPELQPSELAAAQRRIQELQRQVAELTEEREILKKTISIFARRSA